MVLSLGKVAYVFTHVPSLSLLKSGECFCTRIAFLSYGAF